MDLIAAFDALPATLTTRTKLLIAGAGTLLILALATVTVTHSTGAFGPLYAGTFGCLYVSSMILFGLAAGAYVWDTDTRYARAREALGSYLLDTHQLIALKPARIDFDTSSAACQAVTTDGQTVDVDITWHTHTLTPGVPLPENFTPVTVRIRS